MAVRTRLIHADYDQAANQLGYFIQLVGVTNAADGSTQVAVAHTLGRVPKVILFTLADLMASPPYISAASDATNIYIKGAAADTNKNFYIYVA